MDLRRAYLGPGTVDLVAFESGIIKIPEADEARPFGPGVYADFNKTKLVPEQEGLGTGLLRLFYKDSELQIADDMGDIIHSGKAVDEGAEYTITAQSVYTTDVTLRGYDNSDIFIAEDVVSLNRIKVDLDIDSDNNNGMAPIWTRTILEDEIESQPGKLGKIINTNINDDNNNGIPDYSDSQVSNEDNFVPLVVELTGDINWSNAQIRIDYPGDLTLPAFSGKLLANGPATDASGNVVEEPFYDYREAKSGIIRIWNIASPADPRAANDYIAPGQVYDIGSLGLSSSSTIKTFYIEGINKSLQQQSIKCTLINYGLEFSDTVFTTVVEVNLGTNNNNNETDLRPGIPDIEFVIDENDEDEIVEDQNDGFSFWWGRDSTSTDISPLGLVDLAPFIVETPKTLRNAGFKFYLMIGGSVSLDVYPSVGESNNRRFFLMDEVKGNDQINESANVVEVDVTPKLITIDKDRQEFVFKAKGTSMVRTKLSLLMEQPATSNKICVDSVKMTLKQTRDFYTLMSSRLTHTAIGDSTKPTQAHTYFIEPTRSVLTEKYPPAKKFSGPDPDSKKTKYLIHVHGYNVDPVDDTSMYGEMGEVFRRTFWTGFRGNFIGFTWHGDETKGVGYLHMLGLPTDYAPNVENAFQTAPVLLDYLQFELPTPPLNAKPENIDLFLHSLGNQVGLDALRLYTVTGATSKLINTLTSIEAAVWAETFWEEQDVTYFPPSDQITYSVAQMKKDSWAFWFNQASHNPITAVEKYIRSYNGGDWAVTGMALDDVLIRNGFFTVQHNHQYIRPRSQPGPGMATIDRVPYKSTDPNSNLAYSCPAMMKLTSRVLNTIPYALTSYTGLVFAYPGLFVSPDRLLTHGQRPLVTPSIPGVVNIDAAAFGWFPFSHNGHKGGVDQDLFKKLPDPTKIETPLYKIWLWFEELTKNDAYPIGIE